MPDDDKGKQGLDHDFEIFSVGTWNGDKYSVDDLDEMVRNFDALTEQVKPPLKLGHDDAGVNMKLKGGQPALGWVKALKRVGEKLVATVTGMPEIVAKAIEKGLYKRVSSEIYWNLKLGDKTYKRVLSAVALLGATIPAVTNLKDLEVFLSQSMLDAASFDGCKAYSFDTDSNGQITRSNDMDEEKIRKEYEQKLADEKKAREAAEQKLAEFEAERVKKLKEDRTGELKAFCEEQVKAGKMTPAQRDVITAKHAYADEGGVSIPFDALKEFMDKGGKQLPVGEKGHDKKDGGGESGDFKTVFEEADAVIKKHMTDKKVSYSEAFRAVLAEDKDLAERYLKATHRSLDDDE